MQKITVTQQTFYAIWTLFLIPFSVGSPNVWLSAADVAAKNTRPLNVVVILADDLGWSDTTLYGHTSFHRTPNLQRLADRGMTFTHAYSASPLCSPTRSSILTGLNPARTGITTPNCHDKEVILNASVTPNAPPGNKSLQCKSVTRLNTTYPGMGTILRDAGYVTGHFGKWHLGLEPYSPLEHGFSVDLPHTAGPGPAGNFVAPWKFPNFKENMPNEHIEDRMAKEAAAFMEAYRDQPFFLNYWMFSVHAPFNAKEEYIKEAAGRIDANDAQRSPTYAAMIHSFDDAIGTLIDTLDRLKLTERTLIIFTSDNGGNMYNTVDATTPTSNRPLRGGKATVFEGGIRVPWVVSCPSVTAPKSTSNALVQSTDILSTVLDVLQIKPPTGMTSDGISIVPALKGQALERDAIFTYFPHAPGVPDWLPPSVSIHAGDWKLIRLFHNGDNGAHQYLLYNLANDLGEKQNLAAQEPDRVRALDARIEQFLKDTKAVVPTANPKFDATKYRPELVGVPTEKKPADKK